jgi:hypothetical protein
MSNENGVEFTVWALAEAAKTAENKRNRQKLFG